MADLFSKKKRSAIMAAVKGKNTGPEKSVARLFRRLDVPVRRHYRGLPATPDFVLRDHKVAVLIHGCFWHGHENCARAVLPAVNRKFWKAKIEKNRRRDARQRTQLRREGWKVLTFWTCRKFGERQLCSRLARVGVRV